MEIKKPDTVGYILIITLLSLLIYAGWLSAKSIQWGVLKNMEINNIDDILEEFDDKWYNCNCEGGFDMGQCSENDEHKCNSTILGEESWKFLGEQIKKFLKENLLNKNYR